MNYFYADKQISKTSFEKIKKIIKNINDELFLDFWYLLNLKQFYECFCSYLKKLIKDCELEKLNNSKYKAIFYSIFKNLSKEDIKSYLFNLFDDLITSYVRQDIILIIFNLKTIFKIFSNA